MNWRRFFFGAFLGSSLGEVTGQASVVTHGIFFASAVMLAVVTLRDLPNRPRSR